MKKFIVTLLIYALPQIILSLFKVENKETYGIIISTIILWMSEYLALAYTSLLIPLVAAFLGIMSFKEALQSFAHPILFLFIACFFLSIAFNRSGLDRRISLIILKTSFFSKNSTRLLVSVSLLSWLLSMWISNTAACAILIPILLGLSKDDSINLGENLLKKLLISCAYAASIGGLCTPVGSPPNLLALDTLSKLGHEISFVKWIAISLPISLLMLVALLLILNVIFKEEKTQIDCAVFKDQFKELGKISQRELITLLSFGLCVLFWIFPTMLLKLGVIDHKLTLAQAGLLGTIPLFVFSLKQTGSPLLEWQQVQKSLDWGIIFLFAGGLTLGHIMDSTGVAATIASYIFNDQSNVLLLGIIVTFFGIILSELGSNTASAALILPLLGALSSNSAMGDSIVFLTLCATFGASFGFMLPVSTPPNALAFSTGKLKIRDLVTAGIFFDILGLIVISGVLYGLLKVQLI